MTQDLDWLKPGEFPSRVFAELATKKNNDLSLYRCDGSQASIQRIVAALNKDVARKTSYRFLDEDTLIAAGYTVKQRNGDTNDREVNTWHVDVCNMSGRTIYEVAAMLHAAERTEGEYEEDEILEFIADSRDAGYIKEKDISRKITPLLRSKPSVQNL